MIKSSSSFFFTLLFLLPFSLSHAQTFNSGFSATALGSGWVLPMGVTFNKTGTKLFVWEKGGKVYLFNWNSPASNEVSTGPVVRVYPNPGNGWFHLSVGQATGGAGYLKVFDARGVVVLQKSLMLMQGKNQFDLPLHNKPNGIYYFQLQYGGRSIVTKAIKY